MIVANWIDWCTNGANSAIYIHKDGSQCLNVCGCMACFRPLSRGDEQAWVAVW